MQRDFKPLKLIWFIDYYMRCPGQQGTQKVLFPFFLFFFLQYNRGRRTYWSVEVGSLYSCSTIGPPEPWLVYRPQKDYVFIWVNEDSAVNSTALKVLCHETVHLIPCQLYYDAKSTHKYILCTHIVSALSLIIPSQC